MFLTILTSCIESGNPGAVYDFESQDFSGFALKKLRFPYSGYITDSISRNGKYSMRFELRKGDEVGWDQGSRAELKEDYNAPFKKEIWYGLSLFIPEDFPELEKNCVLAQWHGEHDLGEVSRSPVLAIRIEKNRLYFNARYNEQKFQTRARSPQIEHFELNDFPRNEWLDFVVNAVWTHEKDGALNAWMNGEKIISYKGPTGYNDDLGPYFKFGLYKHSGNKPLIVFADEYRRGRSRDEVDPALFGE